MTKSEALELLKSAPRGDSPSRVNPILTEADALDIVEGAVISTKAERLPDWLALRVRQVSQNRTRPSGGR